MEHTDLTARARLLMQQRRYADAEKELSNLLAQNPNDAQILGLAAEVNLQQDKLINAQSIIGAAIAIEPDNALLFYIKSRIEIHLDNYQAAEKSIRQSIELEPLDADYFACLANIKIARKDFEEALQYANKALELDAENLLALNTRSTALNKLNRAEESFQTIEGALREDPNNAYTHANYGWALLEKGNHKKALEHFKESLKNDPSFEYAQSGMREAIKATNIVYRLFLRYSFWIGNLKGRSQWAAIVGIMIGFRILRTLAAQDTVLRPVLIPITIVVGLLLFSTWILEPLSNLILRFNRYGNLLLSKDEKWNASLVGASLLLGLIGIAIYMFTWQQTFAALGVFGIAMSLPLGRMFGDRVNQKKYFYSAIVLGGLGLAAVFSCMMSGELFNGFAIFFLLGFVAFQWLANHWSIKESNY